MPKTSYHGQIMRIPEEAFDADEPVSAGRAFDVRSNLRHLCDQYSQHRINWCAGMRPEGSAASVNAGFVDVLGSTGGSLYEHEFPLTWLGANHPCSLDLLIRTSVDATDGEMTVRTRIVPAYYAVGDLSGDSIFDDTSTVVDGAPGVLDEQVFLYGADATTMGLLRSAAVPRFVEILENEEWHYPEVSMLKLQVFLQYVDGDAPVIMSVTGALVREFA